MNIHPHIIRQSLQGDQSAHAQLYTTTAGYAFSVANRYLSNKEDCRDALQEAYAQVFKHLKQYDPAKAEFKFWLRRIVINVCLKQLDRSKLLTVEAKEAPEPSDDSYLDQFELSRIDIRRLLAAMPERYRVVFMLSILDGYTHKEIAEQLNITPETSRSQLTRAKQWLKLHLEGSAKWEQYGLL